MTDLGRMAPDFTAKRVVRKYVQRIQAPPERVFPLLCPVREYDWIESWKCEVLYSNTGIAEKNCVFRTDQSVDGPEDTWVVSTYEPPVRIEFVRFNGLTVIAYLIVLKQEPDGSTSVSNEQVLTGLSPAGNRSIDAQNNERFVLGLRAGEVMLNHFLTTGTRLPFSEALAKAHEAGWKP